MATGRAGLFLVLPVVISNFRTQSSSFSVKWAIYTSYLVLSICTRKISMQKCGCTERLFRHYVRLLSFEEILLNESSDGRIPSLTHHDQLTNDLKIKSKELLSSFTFLLRSEKNIHEGERIAEIYIYLLRLTFPGGYEVRVFSIYIHFSQKTAF